MKLNEKKSCEPLQLRRGKEFQKKVQTDYKNSKDGRFTFIEKHVSFEKMKSVKQKFGRMDIFVYESGDDYVTIMELKATDWDKIKEKNIKRNLYRHSNQLYRYIDKFMEIDKKNVCLAMIYPEPPKKTGLRDFIEKCAMDEYSFPVYWYSELQE